MCPGTPEGTDMTGVVDSEARSTAEQPDPCDLIRSVLARVGESVATWADTHLDTVYAARATLKGPKS
ncbi:hypothetical protein Pmi06nite_66470 [Planotetraspora mira]|uniref:Uncharacterized protein n=2 Tax=Planotetraspora mira TaxID=58121 RepID=A0A8J3TUI9_9ACTN|nr:hypothetical protein Pmi06nite_66470 [Planotetraspora mira]